MGKASGKKEEAETCEIKNQEDEEEYMDYAHSRQFQESMVQSPPRSPRTYQ